MKIILLLSFIWCAPIIFGQDNYSNLTVLLKNIPKEKVEKEIYSIYNRQKLKTTEERLELKLWKFCMLDSLSFSVPAQNLALELQSSVPKMKNAKRYLVYEHLSEDYYDKSDYKSAISYSFKIIRLDGIDEKGKADANRMIGLSYSKLQQYRTAIKYLNNSIEGYTKLNMLDGVSRATMTLGNVYKSQKKFDLALETYEKSLELAKEIKNIKFIAGNYNNIGSAYRGKKEYQKAIDYYLKALEINVQSGNKQWESFNYNNLANCYSDLKNDQKAIDFYKRSVIIKLELGDSVELMETYSGMSESFGRLKNYREAYKYSVEHSRMKKQYDFDEQARSLAELEGKYNLEKKQIQIEKLKAQTDLEILKNDQLEFKADRNRIFFILLGFIGVLLVGGLIYLYRSNNTRQRLNEALSSANRDISLKNTEIIDSINYATQIQRASLPNLTEIATKHLSCELFFAPKDIVSGDFYFSYSNGRKTYFGLGDCTGHGVPGAMVSLIGLNAFEKVVNDKSDFNSVQMIEEVNRSVIKSLYRGEEINDGMDVSFCVFDEEKMSLNYVGANHSGYLLRKNNQKNEETNLPLRIENNGFKLFQLNGARRPIGKSYSKDSFYEIAIKLQPGDRIILGTDGYADQFGGERGKKLKKARLVSSLMKSANHSVVEQLEFLKSDFFSWKGTQEQVDDVCVLIVEIQ